jgi:peptide/nickel transport system ATP-binding protein
MYQHTALQASHQTEQEPERIERHHLLRLRDLTVDFNTRTGPVRVLHGVNLTVHPGEILGLVGESGSGKSVTCLAAIRLLGATARITGHVSFDGADVLAFRQKELTQLRGAGIAMIFQDPMSSLNPIKSIGWQIAESLVFNANGGNGRRRLTQRLLHVLKANRGLTGADARHEVMRLLDCVGIPDSDQCLREFPHQLSGGMNQRAMIAMALAGQPRLLIADEPTTALDVTIQAQILDLLRRLRDEFGMAVILITHDLGVVAEVCDRMAVMYAGRVVEHGSVNDVFTMPFHPYTHGLLASLPRLDRDTTRLEPIKGTVPAPHALPAGCAFAPRCPNAEDICSVIPPKYCFCKGNRGAACILTPGYQKEITDGTANDH